MLTEPLSFYDLLACAALGGVIVGLLLIRQYAPREPEGFDD